MARPAIQQQRRQSSVEPSSIPMRRTNIKRRPAFRENPHWGVRRPSACSNVTSSHAFRRAATTQTASALLHAENVVNFYIFRYEREKKKAMYGDGAGHG